MRKLAFTICLMLLTVSCGRAAIAQDAPPQSPPAHQAAEVPVHFFHLVFLVQELGSDGKATNSRSYTTVVSTDPHESGSIRTSSRIPVVSGTVSKGDSQALVNTQYQYIDVGVNIDTNSTREIGHKLSIHITADVSSLASLQDENLHQPIIRGNKWQSTVLIPLEKPTVIFMSDSLDNKGSMQMVVTATPLQ